MSSGGNCCQCIQLVMHPYSLPSPDVSRLCHLDDNNDLETTWATWARKSDSMAWLYFVVTCMTKLSLATETHRRQPVSQYDV
jgi:hypothetical protein